MKTSSLIIAAGLAVGLTGAQAATVTFTQSAAFFAALSAPIYAPSQTETYESYATDTQILNGGTLGSYTYSGFPSYDDGTVSGRIDQRDESGANVGFFSVAGGLKSLGAFFTPIPAAPAQGDYFFNGEGFTVALPAGTRAIGLFFNISTANTPNSTDLFINTAVGNATNGGSNYDTTQGNNDPTVPGGTKNLFFVGLISPFTSADIGEAAAGNTGYNVDNLTTTTPEPTSLGLLGFGAMGIVGYSRKRNRR